MLRSGLLLLLVFVAALTVEQRLASRHQLRFAWVIAAVLATGVTLSVGSVQGVAQAWRQRGALPGDPTAWRDGERVRVEGVLRRQRASAEPISAPYTGRPVAYLEYSAFAPRAPGDVSVSQRAHWRGVMADALELETTSGRVRLEGMPPVRFWPEDQMTSASWHGAAARHVLTTTWQPGSLMDAGASEALQALTGLAADASGRIARHVMNVEAAAALGLREGPAPSEETLTRRLAERVWTFTERVVPPDARVTVVGTYHAAPPRLDVGLSATTAEHAVHIGAAATLAERAWRGTLLFALALIMGTVAAHAVVFGPGAAWLRGSP